MYLEQVERQKKISSFLVEIDEKKEYEIDKILSRQDMGKKLKYLVIWERDMVEGNTWEMLENLGNTMELAEEFKKEIKKKKIKWVKKRKEKKKERKLDVEAKVFKRSKLLEKYTAKILFGWDDGRFKDKYLKKLERSWAKWKGKGSQVYLKVEP